MKMMIERIGLTRSTLRRLAVILAIALTGSTGTALAQRAASPPGVIEARLGDGGAMRSTDGGATWTMVSQERLGRERSEQARGAAWEDISRSVRMVSIARAGSMLIMSYDLLRNADVALGICGTRGALVGDEHPGPQGPGSYTLAIDASSLSAGGYCYRVVIDGVIAASGKFILD